MLVVEHKRGNWNIAWTAKSPVEVWVTLRGSGKMVAWTSKAPVSGSLSHVANSPIRLPPRTNGWTSAKIPLLNGATAKTQRHACKNRVPSRRSKRAWARPTTSLGRNIKEIASRANRTKMLACISSNLRNAAVDSLNSAVPPMTLSWRNKYRKTGSVVS